MRNRIAMRAGFLWLWLQLVWACIWFELTIPAELKKTAPEDIHEMRRRAARWAFGWWS